MKILVACEESQAVTIELRKLGHEAYSCDIEPCSGGYPEWHIMDDVMPLLNPGLYYGLKENAKGLTATVYSENRKSIRLPYKWDMIIAFPPCTHLSVSGAKHFEGKREDGRQREAIEFFMTIMNADCDKIAIENPVNIIGGKYIKKWFPDLCERYGLPIKVTQYIQPYEHGTNVTKKTGLWLKGLPKIEPTNIVDKGKIVTFKSGKRMHEFFAKSYGNGSKRSKTFPGIAKAMAEQWGV